MINPNAIAADGSLKLKNPENLPEVLDMLIVGGGPAGTAAAFRAKELGITALVIDFDDLMKRIRDYAKDKLILPGFGGGDKMRFPKADDLISLLHFPPIDKDEMCLTWKGFYREHSIPAILGCELTGLDADEHGVWEVKTWNHNAQLAQSYRARHVVISIGRGVPRRFDIPGNLDGISYRLTDPATYVGSPACVLGGGTSAAEAVIAISNAKRKAGDASAVYWSYRGQEMPKVSKSLADVFFEAYLRNGNIRYHPGSEPVAIVVAEDRKEYLSIRTDRKVIEGRPSETYHLEFPKEKCIACIGEDIPESFLNSLGIFMAVGGTRNRKRMVTTPLLETQQKNVYLIGDILSQAYFETEHFDADPSSLCEIKHRGNIKAALRDGVFVTEVIAQKLAGKEHIEVRLKDAESDEGGEQPAKFIAEISSPLESIGPLQDRADSRRAEESAEATLIRVVAGGVDENEYPLRKGGTTTIGRKECDITFANDTHLADIHASVIHTQDSCFLQDHGSTTGVFLRAVEARPYEVRPGNLIRAGQQFLLFSGPPGSYIFIHYDRAGKEINRHSVAEKTLVLGRESPDIVLDAQDMVLSRRHLAVSTRDNKIYVKDLKSVNGTYIKVESKIELCDGDQFRVGQQMFKFSLKAGSPPEGRQMETVASSRTLRSVPVQAGKKTVGGQTAKQDARVRFTESGEPLRLKQGQTICEVAEEHGLALNAECHSGICGSDPIRIVSGENHLNEVGDQERDTLQDICDLDAGPCRLACMVKPTGPVTVVIL